MIKRKTLLEKVNGFIDKDLIKVLTGLRRCGKSVLLEQIKEMLVEKGISSGNIIYYNFEDMANAHLLNATALHEEIKSRLSEINGRTYLFFDEIQEVEEWERCINSFRVAFDVDIYVTGSNAKLLSGELATLIAGRYIEIRVYPFSFSEFLEMSEAIFPDAEKKELFKKYLLFGGMPFLANLELDPQSSFQYLKDVFDSVILKDVVKRNKIRDIDLLERVIQFVLANVGNTFSATSISRFLKSENRTVSPETILNHIKVCEEAFLFNKVLREDLIGKRILQVSEKYFVTDHGMREAIYGNNERDINLVLENIVFLEMLRRGYKISIGKVNNEEIDFVCRRNNETVYIQVAYLLATEETVKREFDVLRKVPDNYPKIVLSMDQFDFSRDGIKHFNIPEFLTNQQA
ncbi:MAG TPA: ATP-binding protein [bacterium]|nr:ATP-binding protein [bacterium]HPS30484.1 ATP-binding protein [bacterium]